jgi:hypothetical protein
MKKADDKPDATVQPTTLKKVATAVKAAVKPASGSSLNTLLDNLGGAMKKAGDKPSNVPGYKSDSRSSSMSASIPAASTSSVDTLLDNLGGAMKKAGDKPDATPVASKATTGSSSLSASIPAASGSPLDTLLDKLGGAMKNAGDKPDGAPTPTHHTKSETVPTKTTEAKKGGATMIQAGAAAVILIMFSMA